ncbi:uncharacterized protein LOC131669177, partial [Phymastichus coffea]|uniref:uncharacterized protein LOC131669177 n=1 Tax=Phymastichus coffea TaxID=108790 RepID=UPI00273C3CF6
TAARIAALDPAIVACCAKQNSARSRGDFVCAERTATKCSRSATERPGRPGGGHPCAREARLGCWAALGLGVLETKRLLLLLGLEMLLDSRAMRFAGALAPFAFSLVDAGLGLPVAVGAVLSLRRQQVRDCQWSKRRGLRRVAALLAVGLLLNVLTLLLIGGKVNPEVDSLRDAFGAAMRLYARNASYKLLVDELQLGLRCCGASSYADWLSVDWQVPSDVARGGHGDTEDERGVPYSCCDKRAALPCAHADVREEADVKTLNGPGCASALGRMLLKIAVVGYTMTSLVACTQLLLLFFAVRVGARFHSLALDGAFSVLALVQILVKAVPGICSSDTSRWRAPRQPAGLLVDSSSDECSPRCGHGRHTGAPNVLEPRKFYASDTSRWSSGQSVCTTSCSSDSWSSSSSSSHAGLTSSPSCAPETSDRAGMTSSASDRVQRQLPDNQLELDE